MVQGEPWGLHGFFSTVRLACSNLRQENEEVWRCSSLSSICWDYVLNGKCSDWCPVECVGCYHCGVMCIDWLPSWYCVCVGCLAVCELPAVMFGKTASMRMLTLFESRYTLKGRYNIGNVGKTASMSMLTLFESRYTLKGRYNIGNVGKTASMSMLTLFEIKIYIEGKVQYW